MGQVIERPLPHNDEVERAVLGAILVGHKRTAELFDILTPRDFFDARHRKLLSKMLELRTAGRDPDLLALHDELTCSDEIEAVGGIGYLASLGDGVPAGGDVMQPVRRLREMASLRDLIHTADWVQQLALERAEPAERLLDQAIEKFSDLARDIESARDDGTTHFDAATRALLELGEDPGPRIYTDLDPLDRWTGGFRAGELIVVCSETGVGKTLLAQQTRARACRDGFHSLFCSGEMLASHLKRRELAAEAGVSPSKMRRDDLLTPEERLALIEVSAHQCKQCRILDGELTLSRIRRLARRMKAESGLDLVILDYDELIEAPGKDEFEQQRNLARAAKSLGMELHCSVVLISQLRKPLSGEDAKRPTLQRIYGTGAKVKHASIVLLADREYVRELSGDETKARIVVLKNRDGRVGALDALFNVRTLRFESAPKAEDAASMWRHPSEPAEREQ